ncbi:MAG: YkgJ family cysteine cluster protein, partial [Candidatus Thermoplasmatota archaeon]
MPKQNNFSNAVKVKIFETDIIKIKDICEENEEENHNFRIFIKSGDFDYEKFRRIVDEVEKQIDCTTCGNCCKVLSVKLTEEDIQKIAKHLKISEDKFIKKYVTKNNEGKCEFKYKPCIFLENNKCTIREVRPQECREFPHLKKDITTRTIQFIFNAEVCPIAFNVLENAKIMLWDDIVEEIENFDPSKYEVIELCDEVGTCVTAINDDNRELFYPILFAIEESIVNYYKHSPSLKDADIIVSLKKIRDNIFSKTSSFNELENEITNRIKVVLFLNNYSRRDVFLSISCILKSVKLHKSTGGNRGYLS